MKDLWATLDLAILNLLPDEGAMEGKYLPLGLTSKQIADKLDDPEVSSARVGRRVTALGKMGLVVGHGTGEGKNSWQRTAKGKRRAEERSEA